MEREQLERVLRASAAITGAGLVSRVILLNRRGLLADTRHQSLVRPRIERAFGAATPQ